MINWVLHYSCSRELQSVQFCNILFQYRKVENYFQITCSIYYKKGTLYKKTLSFDFMLTFFQEKCNYFFLSIISSSASFCIFFDCCWKFYNKTINPFYVDQILTWIWVDIFNPISIVWKGWLFIDHWQGKGRYNKIDAFNFPDLSWHDKAEISVEIPSISTVSQPSDCHNSQVCAVLNSLSLR